MKFKRTLSVASICMSLAISLPAMAQTVRVAVNSDVLTTDPTMDITLPAQILYQNIYDQLTEFRADGTLGPRLALEWKANEDASVWTFKLRSGVKFHDGSPMTVEDIAWTVKKIQSEERSPLRIFLSKIDRVEKLAEDEVRFHLKSPYAVLDRQLTILSILPGKVYEKVGAAEFSQRPVGSGPYKLIRWAKDDRIELEANNDYWRGRPGIQQAVLRPVATDSSRVAALLSGDVDLVSSLPPVQVERVSNAEGMKVAKITSNRASFLGFNANAGALSDVRVRKAIDFAIDRKAISEQLLRGFGVPLASMIPPNTFGHDETLKVTPFDPEKAKQLLAEAGYKGEEIIFEYPTTVVLYANEIAAAIQGMLSNVGIRVTMRPSEYTSFFPLWSQRKMQGMYLMSYASSLFDGDSQATGLFETGSRAYLLDPRIDEASKKQRASADPAVRQQAFSTILNVTAELATYVPLLNDTQGYGYRASIGQWTPRADGQIRLFDIKPQ